MPDGFEDDIQKAVRKVRDKAYKGLYREWTEDDYLAIKWALTEVRREYRSINRQRLYHQQNVAAMQTHFDQRVRVIV